MNSLMYHIKVAWDEKMQKVEKNSPFQQKTKKIFGQYLFGGYKFAIIEVLRKTSSDQRQQ